MEPGDNKPKTNELDQNQGPVTDPSGIVAAGGTQDQAKMAGTPVQVQANIEMQQRAQDQRRAEQEQQTSAEEQRLAGTTLRQKEAFERAAPATEQQDAAMQIANTLNTLGPVRTRVQSLIQERLQAAQTATTQLAVDEQALNAITDPTKRQEASNALSAYLADPSEKNLAAVYSAVGAESTKDLEKFFTSPEGTVQESFEQAFAIAPTLGNLDLKAADVDVGELAKQLNVTEAQLSAMTLDQLNAQIDAIEAAELNRVEQIQARLQDPALTPAMREALMDELRQLGAAGLVGAEVEVDAIQEQIDAAQEIDVLGRSMSIEELLSDEGMSSLVSKAALDDDLLQSMKDDPEYAALAGWIEQNKASLALLAQEYEEQGVEFTELQDEYQKLLKTFGEDGMDLLKSIYGKDFKDVILSGEFENVKAKLEATPLFRTLSKKGNEKYAAILKQNPELAKKFLESGYEDTEIEYVFDIKEHLDQGGYFTTLIGAEGVENGYLFDQDRLDEIRKTDLVERYDNLDPTVTAGAMDIQKNYQGEGPYLSIKDLEAINDSENKDDLLNDIGSHLTSKNEANKKYGLEYSGDGKLIGANIKAIMQDAFDDPNFDYRDLNAQLDSKDVSKEQKEQILRIFDTDGKDGISAADLGLEDIDGDGVIGDAELKRQAEVAQKLMEELGLDKSKEDVVAKDGDWELGKVDQFVIPPDAAEKVVYTKSSDKLSSLQDEGEKRINALNTQNPTFAPYANIKQYNNTLNTSFSNFSANDNVHDFADRFAQPGGWQEWVTEIGNLRGFSRMSPYGKGVATDLLWLIENNPLTNEEIKALKSDGFKAPKLNDKGELENSDTLDLQKKALDKVKKRFSLIKSKLDLFLDHIKNKRSEYTDVFGNKREGHRIAKALEGMRGQLYETYENAINNMTDSFNTNVYSKVGEAKKFGAYDVKRRNINSKLKTLKGYQTNLNKYNKDLVKHGKDLDTLSSTISTFKW